MLQQRSWSAGVLANDTARGRKSTRLEIFHYSWRSSQFGGIFAQSRGKRKDVYKNHLGCWCAQLGRPPLAEPHRGTLLDKEITWQTSSESARIKRTQRQKQTKPC